MRFLWERTSDATKYIADPGIDSYAVDLISLEIASAQYYYQVIKWNQAYFHENCVIEY